MTVFAHHALLPDGWGNDVRLESRAGLLVRVESGARPAPGDEHAGIVVPGMPNVHSHAFQRGMAGLAEIRGPAEDNFWSWRETMYRFALTMTPDHVEAVAALLYVEMLEAGFTRVGEFHYLHHDTTGRPYADPAEMAVRIAAATSATGIGLTLLPVFYAHSTFGGAAPGPGQRRFISDLDGFSRLLEGSGRALSGLPGARLGVAPHSLRAVAPDELRAVVDEAAGGPIHIHAAEQVREVEDCLAWSGARPVAWLLDNAPVGPNWCLIHATHMDASEITALARSGAVAGLCPITEANLGDGVFPTRSFADHGGRFGIGSDSNIRIGVVDELRQLEYAQRLHFKARNVMADSGGSTGRALFNAALSGGTRALGGGKPTGLAVGAPADFVSLEPSLQEIAGDLVLDAWIFAAAASVDNVWVGGVKRVEGGRHILREPIVGRFKRVMSELLSA